MDMNDARADWAEALDDLGPDTQIYSGEQSRSALADLLDGDPAVGGASSVERRLRGRPSLSPDAPRGNRSRQLNVRIGESTERRLEDYLSRTSERPSDVLRQALDEFLQKRSA